MIPAHLSATTLARVRACRAAGIAASPELMAMVELCLADVAEASSRKRLRDKLIRRAVLFLPAARPYAQAGRLACEAKAMARTRHGRATVPPTGMPSALRECLQAAVQFDELPASQRQFYRVLTGDPY